MSAYNPAGRGFWIEAYGGRPYRVERQKHPEPIDIPRLAVAVYGTTQPEKLALLMRGPDDGLFARPSLRSADLIVRSRSRWSCLRSADRLVSTGHNTEARRPRGRWKTAFSSKARKAALHAARLRPGPRPQPAPCRGFPD